MNFQAFCRKYATEGDFSQMPPMHCKVPEKYEVATKVMIDMMKNKRDGFDRINVPFVEMCFENNDYEKLLEEKLPDGEIDDAIIIRLSEGIFNEQPAALDVNQASIIKVLATYICIQN